MIYFRKYGFDIWIQSYSKSAYNFLNIEDIDIKTMYQKCLKGSKEAIDEPNGTLGPLCAKFYLSLGTDIYISDGMWSDGIKT